MAKRTYTPPPAKPRGMSERRYRELHDSTPTTVTVDGTTQYRCAGPVSAEVIARSHRAAGRDVRIEH